MKPDAAHCARQSFGIDRFEHALAILVDLACQGLDNLWRSEVHEAPSARDCCRFVLSNPAVDVCMCGPGDLNRMRDALEALGLGPLNPDEMGRIRIIGDHVHRHSRNFV